MGRRQLDRPKRLAEKLSAIRARMGLSQNQLIAALGFEKRLSQAEVSAFELGKRVPPLTVLLKYARIYKITVDDLIDDAIDLK